MFIVVSCEHGERTELPMLVGKFDTKDAAEAFVKQAVADSLAEFKDEHKLEDNIVVTYDNSGVINYSCVWEILEI